MGHLLFSPNGYIGKAEFTKGAVILLAANFVLWLAWYINLGVGLLAGLGSLVFIYCWICLFAKRFADAGKSGAMFILVFLAFLVLSYILANILTFALSPDLIAKAEELQALSRDDPNNVEAIMPLMTDVMRSLAVPYAVAYFIAGSITAFGTNAILKTQVQD